MKCLSLGVVRHVKAYLICSLGIKKSLFYGDVLIKCFWGFFVEYNLIAKHCL